RPPIEHEESGDRTNMKQRKEHGAVPVNTFNSILKRYVVHTPPKYSLLVDRSCQGSAQCHIHASRLEDLVYQFDTTSHNAGRQCDNTHICFDRQSLTEAICGPTHRPLS